MQFNIKQAIYNNWLLILFFALFFSILLLFSVFFPTFPLNGDEAWNYLGFSRFGPVYSATNYQLPNNHIFFTILQSLIVKKKILVYFPLEVRLLNCVVGAAVLSFLGYLGSNLLKKKMSVSLFLFVAVCSLFASPLVTPYLIVARGYLLGTLLLILGVYFLAVEKFYKGSVAFIFSVWTIPTFILALPIIYIICPFIFKKTEWKKICISGLAVPVGALTLYIPVVNQILENTNVGWGYGSVQKFSYLTFNSISNVYWIFGGLAWNIVFLLVYFYSLIEIYKNKKFEKMRRFVMLCFAGVVSYLVAAHLMFALQLKSTPFTRNGIFIPLVIVVTIFFASRVANSQIKKFLLVGILTVNMLLGLFFFLKANIHDKNYTYPVFEGEQSLNSKSLIKFFEGKDKKSIENDTTNTVQITFYSFIYDAKLLEKEKH